MASIDVRAVRRLPSMISRASTRRRGFLHQTWRRSSHAVARRRYVLPAVSVALSVAFGLCFSVACAEETLEDYLRRRLPDITGDAASGLDATPKWLAPADRNAEVLVDDATGLVLPPSPFEQPMEILPPDDPRTKAYLKSLEEYYFQRMQLLKAREEYYRGNAELGGLADPASSYFANKVLAWNGEIFWAPASKEPDYVGQGGMVTRTGDEIRAVFGAIPPFDVSTLTPGGPVTRPDGSQYECRMLPLQVDGNLVELKPNTSVAGNPLQFEHTDVNGAHVKWTTEIDKCDAPSLAGGVTPCGASSRIAVIRQGNVEWIALARKTKGVEPLQAEEFWLPANPDFPLLGYIGFNRDSGEVTFLAENQGAAYQYDVPEAPPGGTGYDDATGRSQSKNRYDGLFSIQCARCHDNKEPRTITPYIKQARVGYFDAERRGKFSTGTVLPEQRRFGDEPYRVVGTGFTAGGNQVWINDSRVIQSLNSCTSCHVLTTRAGSSPSGTAVFSADAINRLQDVDPDSFNNEVGPARTDWAQRTGDGKVHPWMCTGGNRLANALGQPYAELSSVEQQQLLDAIASPPTDAPRVYNQAPAPESIADVQSLISDSSYATVLAPLVAANRDGDEPAFPREIKFQWNYHNSFGGVPTRDDVRFHLAIRETPIPADGSAPSEADYPTLEQARGLAAVDLGNGVYRDGDILIIKNIAFAGHLKWTDPAPTTGPRTYSVTFPAKSGTRYLVRLLSKRFTFDQISANSTELGVKFSTYDKNRTFVDSN